MASATLIWRRGFGAGRLLVWLVLAAAVGFGLAQVGSQGGSAVSHSGVSTAAAAHRGLSALPVAARGPISGALGGADRSYAVRGGPAGFSAVNAAQSLRLAFARSGVVVRSGSSRLSLGLAAIGYGSRLHPLGAVVPSYRANRVSYAHRSVSEWYVNGPLGLEQGYTIPHRLARGGGPLTLSLAVGGGLRPVLAPNGRSVAFRTAGGEVVFAYRGLVASDARGHRLAAWLSVGAGRLQVHVRDRGARYPLRIDPFVQQARLIGSGAVGSEQGFSVALSADGNTALVGGPRDNGDVGAAWVFTRSGSAWIEQAKLVGTGAVGGARQGWSVALSADGNTALVGGPHDNGDIYDSSGAGAAWVFTRSGSTWSQQGSKLVGTGAVASGLGIQQGSGVALSADGNTALVGGWEDHSDVGAAWVFTRSGSTWTQQGPKLVGTGALNQFGVYQGYSVALSADGNTALVGGHNDNNEVGATWVFTRSGSTWSQQGPKLVATDATSDSEQGFSVALSADGNTALIGGIWLGTPGAAWVFTRSASTWSQQGPKLVGTDAPSSGEFGWSVALSADANTALIGGEDAAWLFTRSGSSWSQLSKLVVAPAPKYKFEFSVAISGDAATALVGGPGGAWDSHLIGAAWVFVMRQPPTVDSFAPGSGITGSKVTITGTNLSGASSVKFGSLAASFTVVSGTQISATVPDGAVPGKISVTTPAGTATSSQSFTPSLSVTSFSPTCGPFGTGVTLRGVGFTPGSTVKFNGIAATTVKYLSSGEAQATVPSTATSGPITLTNTSAPAGTVESSGHYTVTPHTPPTISSFTPGSTITGTKVTITGTNLCGANSIKFGSLAAPNFSVYSPTQLGVRVPDGAVTGAITVTTTAGTAASSQSFTPSLSITAFSPASGPVGTVVDIKGIGFTPGATVKFNGTPATTVAYIGSGEVKATAPTGATSGQITLTNTTTPAGTVTSAKTYAVTTTKTISGTRPIATLAITTPLAV